MNQVVNQPAAQTSLAAMRQPAQAERFSVSLTDSQGFELVQRAAKCLAASSLVPKEYQGNIPNCVIALNMSNRLGADALMVMQNLVIVHGRPTWSSQFMIATVNTCGRFTALRYEFFGNQGEDGWGCRAWAIERETGEKLVGTDVTLAIAKREGWFGKSGSKWQSIPQQMLMYRAGSWWARAYAPELSMGLHTADEVADVIDMNADGSVASVSVESLRTVNNGRAEVVQQPPQMPAESPAAPEVKPADAAPATGTSITMAATDYIDMIDADQQQSKATTQLAPAQATLVPDQPAPAQPRGRAARSTGAGSIE